MKKKLALFTMTLAALVLVTGNSMADSSPVGVWKNIDDKTKKAKAHIQVFENNGVVSAKIIKLLQKPQDTLCDKCKGDLYNKPVVGMAFVWGLKYDAKSGEYTGGRILDPDNGKTYKCYIQVLDNGKKLKVRGYLGFSLFGRTQYWYRVN